MPLGLRTGRRRRWLVASGVVVLLVAVAFGALALASGASLSGGGEGLASVGTPFTGGTIESATAQGADGRPIPVALHGSQVWPLRHLPPGATVTVEAVLRRPGWIGWLAGSTEHMRVTVQTPTAQITSQYVTLGAGAPLTLMFDRPVEVVAYGPAGALRKHALAAPASTLTLPRTAAAGTIVAMGSPRSWERLPGPTVVSWFPAGSGTSAVASPQPGGRLTPASAVTLSFSTPVESALHGALPRFSPATPGQWQTVGSHSLVFHPAGYGFPMGAPVQLVLPSGVHPATGSTMAWYVPPGSPAREEQILAQLGYLPLSFTTTGTAVAPTPQAQARAAVEPPAGSFSWRWGDVPAALHGLWDSGERATLVRGALMAFESAHEMTPDGVAGPQVWHALLRAAAGSEHASGGYTFVDVSEGSQSLQLWHDGRTVMSTPVNTGIASAPTATGTYPVFEHISSGTMSGTNPDGSHYSDPGVPWISYFNGGDALHGFTRAQYGFPQSLGCVEMPVGAAGRVWPYTPVGTIVHIT